MNRFLSFMTVFAVIVLMLTGCARSSMQQCAKTNWCQEGFTDGAAGHQPRDLLGTTQTCAKFNLQVDHKCYSKSWLVGAKYYCHPFYQRGLRDGQQRKTLEAMLISRMPFCKQAGLTLNIKDYKRGLLAGLAGSCTYKSGYTIGRRGYRPPNGDRPNVCPGVLRSKFMSGWRAGVRKFCARSHTAFLLGKKGQLYSEVCVVSNYPMFKREYDRGYVVYQRSASLHAKINSLNGKIHDEVVKWGFVKDYRFDNYHLGNSKSFDAAKALQNVRRILSQVQDLQARLLQEKRAK